MAQFYTNLGSLEIAALNVAALTACKIRLFQGSLGTPTPSTTLAELEAAEATYEGYTAGGITVVWGAPYFAAGGGAAINTQLAEFSYVDASPHTGNTIYGFWIDNGTQALIVGTFDQPIDMITNGQAIPLSAQLVFGS